MRAELIIAQEDMLEIITQHVREKLGPMSDEWSITVPTWSLREVTVTIKDKGELARDARYEAEREERTRRIHETAAAAERIVKSPTDSELAAQVAAAADSSHSDPF